MIKYAIPGMYELANLNFKLLDIKKNNPKFFYDDVEIEISYGNPQFCIWDGGRIFASYHQSSIDNIKYIINTYNNVFNIPIRYVFTNNQLTSKEYNNRFCNLLMEAGATGPNEVVVADDNLMYYLKDKYPMYKYVSSTTKVITNPEEAKKEIDREEYKLTCLHYDLNFNFKFLNSLSSKERAKTEFLINPICPAGCQFRKDHYKLNSQMVLNYGKEYKTPWCGIVENNFYPNAHKNHMTYDMIKEKYAPMGFEHFKIEGRTWSELELALTYCEYMIKPEYKYYVLTGLIGR